MIRVIQSLYEGCQTVIQSSAEVTHPFSVEVGLHQGSAFSPFLFAVIMDIVTKTVRKGGPDELIYADDIAISAASDEELQEKILSWQDELERKGLKVNSRKAEVVVSAKSGDKIIQVKDQHDEEIEQVEKFCYLGSVVFSKAGAYDEVQCRVKKGWAKWRKVSGVVCDKMMAIKLMIKVYKSVIRSVLLYVMETLALKGTEERLLEATEMRMLRWICGISLREHRTNEDIRRFAKIASISDKVREARLRWLRHVMRRYEGSILKSVYQARVDRRRSRGRQRLRWKDKVERDIKEIGLRTGMWLDRGEWRWSCRVADPT